MHISCIRIILVGPSRKAFTMNMSCVMRMLVCMHHVYLYMHYAYEEKERKLERNRERQKERKSAREQEREKEN